MEQRSAAFKAVDGLLGQLEGLVHQLEDEHLSKQEKLRALAHRIVNVLKGVDAPMPAALAGGAAAGGDDVRQLALQLVEALRQEGARESRTQSSAGP